MLTDKDREQLNAKRRAKHAANPEKKRAYDRARRAAGKVSPITDEQKAKYAATNKLYRERNKERIAAQKKSYNQSDTGKVAKKRWEDTYKANGGRAKAEERRATRPLSEARKIARLVHNAKKRDRSYCDELDLFTLKEAYHLTKQRNEIVGGKWEVDHVVPISLGGLNKHGNIQVVPSLWNKQKSNIHTTRFYGA